MWLATGADLGLSLNRNKLVSANETPFVQLLDDDFGVNRESHLDLLLERAYAGMMGRPESHHSR